MISVVLYGRNDAHGYNLHRRAALSLNCIAEVLTDPDVFGTTNRSTWRNAGGRDLPEWSRVRANRGAGGVDKLTLAEVEEYGRKWMLGELQRDLREGSYRPAPVRRVGIPRPDVVPRAAGPR